MGSMEPLDAPGDEFFPQEGDSEADGESREWLPDEFMAPDIRVITISVSADNDWQPTVDYHAGISPWEARKLIEEAGYIVDARLKPISAYSDSVDPD